MFVSLLFGISKIIKYFVVHWGIIYLKFIKFKRFLSFSQNENILIVIVYDFITKIFENYVKCLLVINTH